MAPARRRRLPAPPAAPHPRSAPGGRRTAGLTTRAPAAPAPAPAPRLRLTAVGSPPAVHLPAACARRASHPGPSGSTPAVRADFQGPPGPGADRSFVHRSGTAPASPPRLALASSHSFAKPADATAGFFCPELGYNRHDFEGSVPRPCSRWGKRFVAHLALLHDPSPIEIQARGAGPRWEFPTAVHPLRMSPPHCGPPCSSPTSRGVPWRPEGAGVQSCQSPAASPRSLARPRGSLRLPAPPPALVPPPAFQLR
ncbi:protein transport protein SEC31-like [Cebus imitator]|uniref:protein transport protein SEC31-like n=1 Tax=Cebus imitator TaxID=2715852 RepID=UPI000809AC53|nr:protein transport protein SEC31-like [Cebus imitator]